MHRIVNKIARTLLLGLLLYLTLQQLYFMIVTFPLDVSIKHAVAFVSLFVLTGLFVIRLIKKE